jgi:AraC-like DNA-binding protein
MPIYMDIHIVPGVKAKDVADAHRKDLLHQDEHACKCMTYWIDEQRESIFCLIEAPNKDAVIEMHHKAHGLVPNRIIEVSSHVVESFLGRIYDPENAEVSNDGLKVFHDPSYRILVIISHGDPALLQYKLGAEKARNLVQLLQQTLRKNGLNHGGREVEHEQADFIFSFSSAAKAIEFAGAVQRELNEKGLQETMYKIALHGGEPLENSNSLFGDTIRFANYLAFIAGNGQIAVSGPVKNLAAKDHTLNGSQWLCLPVQDESILYQLFGNLEKNWQDAEFDIDSFCSEMAMSKSQLYRKCIAITGSSPNSLIKDYRLLKAKELMKKRGYNIAQVTFESGFTSPSYFTKCFKQKFGILPNAYSELLA